MGALIFPVVLVVALALTYKPLGDHVHRVMTRSEHGRVERLVYRAIGVRPDSEQTWGGYARSVLAFGLVGIVFLYGFQRFQHLLPLSLGFDAVDPALAWNTAVSFVTNTNWQAYAGESTMGHLVQTAGLAVQNFVSAAVGVGVAVALARGFARTRTGTLGNFWVDVTRVVLRVLLPISVVAAIVLIVGGTVQNLSGVTTIGTVAGGDQDVMGGLVASQEAIKHLGTNGGGFANANAAHPFANPTAWTNLLLVYLILMIPVSLPRTFGRVVGDDRQGLAIVAVMGIVAIASVGAVVALESNATGTVPSAIGASMEGREARFGVSDSAVFAAVTTLTSTGSVDSFHDSYSALGGGVLMLNMLLGEVAPGGVGSGLYGLLVIAIVTVFVAGLMVGRTPEYLGKRIGPRQITLVSLYFLVTPVLVLVGTATAIAVSSNGDSLQEGGPHGLSELLYAFASASNNNGSAFAGLGADTPWLNTALGLCMLLGRFLPIVLVLALAGSLAEQRAVPASSGTFPTHTPLFIGMVIGVLLLLVALTYLPVLALGPIAEALA